MNEYSDNNENWMYYRLISTKFSEVTLDCCIDTNTVDDDEPDCQWLQNDGTWNQNVPQYWSENTDYTPIIEELIRISSEEWDVISQILVDCEDTVDEVFVKEFKNCILLVSYDEDFEEYYLSQKKSTIQVDGYVKRGLDKLKVHPRQSNNEIIRMLLNEVKK